MPEETHKVVHARVYGLDSTPVNPGGPHLNLRRTCSNRLISTPHLKILPPYRNVSEPQSKTPVYHEAIDPKIWEELEEYEESPKRLKFDRCYRNLPWSPRHESRSILKPSAEPDAAGPFANEATAHTCDLGFTSSPLEAYRPQVLPRDSYKGGSNGSLYRELVKHTSTAEAVSRNLRLLPSDDTVAGEVDPHMSMRCVPTGASIPDRALSDTCNPRLMRSDECRGRETEILEPTSSLQAITRSMRPTTSDERLNRDTETHSSTSTSSSHYRNPRLFPSDETLEGSTPITSPSPDIVGESLRRSNRRTDRTSFITSDIWIASAESESPADSDASPIDLTSSANFGRFDGGSHCTLLPNDDFEPFSK